MLLLPACQRRSPSPVEQPFAIPQDMKIGVAAFTQPLTAGELIAGNIPERQGRAPADALARLDALLHDELGRTNRLYAWLPKRLSAPTKAYRDATAPSALSGWAAFGRQFNIDFLLAPQLINWHQREGSSAGVTSSAHVRVEFFLIDVKNARVLRRSIFEEKQVGLADNILTMGDFIKRKGAWVTAEDLTREAVAKAVKELGL